MGSFKGIYKGALTRDLLAFRVLVGFRGSFKGIYNGALIRDLLAFRVLVGFGDTGRSCRVQVSSLT